MSDAMNLDKWRLFADLSSDEVRHILAACEERMLVAGKLDGCLATPFPMANAINQSRVPVSIVHQLLSFGFDGYYDDATVVRGSISDVLPVVLGVTPG